MLELRKINLSLTNLGKVIQTLAKGEQKLVKTATGTKFVQTNHAPFRDSKLTRLLQDSIGGNCKTYLIATISPTHDCVDESISTLKFAERASQVMQTIKKNTISAKDDAHISKLQNEINYLKDLL